MFKWRSTLPESSLRVAVLSACCALWGTAAACAATSPADTDRLSSLSTGQLRLLCGELGETWIGERELLECDNGWTVYAEQHGLRACGTQTTACTATAGQWRACMSVLLGDSCQWINNEPAECAALRSAPGCEGVALPSRSHCTPPSTELLAALDGVYEVTSRTRNSSACDVEGPEVEPRRLVALAGMPNSSVDYLAPLTDWRLLGLRSCNDIESCREQMAIILSDPHPSISIEDGPNANLPASFMCTAPGVGALRASGNSSRDLEDQVCTYSQQDAVLRVEPEGAVRLEIRTSTLSQPAGEDACNTWPTDVATRGECVQLEVVRAQFVAPL